MNRSSTIPTLVTAACLGMLLAPVCAYAGSSGLSDHGKTPSSVNYLDYSKSGDRVGGFATLGSAKQFLNAYPGGWIKDTNGTVVYRELDFTTVDLRFPAPQSVNAASINRFLRNHASPLSGLGASFAYAQRVYGVNASYLLAHAIEETGWGRSPLAITKDNLYGTGAFDANTNLAGVFPSLDYAIRYQAWVIRKDYLNAGFSHYASPTLSGIGHNYASDAQWADNVRAVMNQLALFLGDNVNSYKQYVPGTPDPTPIVMTEPAYDLNGATATTVRDRFYAGIPVYASVGDGQLHEFSRPLKLGDTGDDVSTLQTALNQLGNAGLKVSGTFDTSTETALKQFQTNQGLPATGICDFSLWTGALHIPAPKLLPVSRPVSVNQIKQGMVGADVVLWYHVRSQGWVNAYDVRLTNVYRIAVKSPLSPSTTVRVYDPHHPAQVLATLHAGDEVVASSSVASNGRFVIHFANAVPKVGLLKRTDGWLVPVH